MIQYPRQLSLDSARTPEPATVRGAAFAAFLLGAELTLPGIVFTLWSSQSNLDSGLAGQGMLAFGGGVVVGLAALTRPLRQRALADFAVVLSGLCASLSLAALSAAYSPGGVLPSAVGLGIAVGLLLATQPPLVVSVISRAETAAGLMGLAWAWGAIAVSLFVWVFFRVLTLSSMMLLLAALLAAAALLSWLIDPPRRSPPDVVGAGWKYFLTPGGVVLALVVVLFGGAHGTMAGLLSIYVGGKLGSGYHVSGAVPIVYWLTIVTALLAGRRIAALEERPSRMVLALSGCGVGVLFLLRATEPSGIVAGTVVFGAAMGALLSLVFSWISRQAGLQQGSLLRPLVALFVGGGVAMVWAATRVTAVVGIESVVWTAGGSVPAAVLAMVVLLMEARFARARAAAG